jgi:protein-arginine kinase activator protein McsA
MHCVNCEKFDARIVESRLRLNGTRYRRYACNNCPHRWTVNQSNAAKPRPRLPNTGYKAQQVNRKLTNMEVAEIIMSPLTNRELACVYPVSHQSIQKIQTGKTYREVYLVLKEH